MARTTTCTHCREKFHVLERDKWEEDYRRCPFCKILYSDLPKTERKLRELQDIYLINYSEFIFERMYKLLFPYTKSIFLKKFRNKVKDSDNIDYYIFNLLSILAEDYKKRETFYVKASFAGYLFTKMKEVIYGKKERGVGTIYKPKKDKQWSVEDIKNKKSQIDWKKENNSNFEVIPSLSLNYCLPDGNEVEYIDEKSIIDNVERQRDSEILKDQVCYLIFSINKYCNTLEEDRFRLLALYLRLYKGKVKVDNYFSIFSRYGRFKYDQTVEVFQQFLKEIYND